jgi:hypothetical protein
MIFELQSRTSVLNALYAVLNSAIIVCEINLDMHYGKKRENGNFKICIYLVF